MGSGARFGVGAGSVLPSPQAVVDSASNAVARRIGRAHGGGIGLVGCYDRFALSQPEDELLELELDDEPPDVWPPPQPPLLELDDELPELELDDELPELELDELLEPGDEVTVNLCEAERPPRSVANTVTLTVPAARAARVTTVLDVVTLTHVLSDETAPKSSSSPSGSSKCPATSSSATLLTSISMSLILPIRSGARLEPVPELEDDELLLELEDDELLLELEADELLLELDDDELLLLELDDDELLLLELDDDELLLLELDDDELLLELDDELSLELDEDELDDELLLDDELPDPPSARPTRPAPAFVQAASCVIPAPTTPPASSRRNSRRSSWWRWPTSKPEVWPALECCMLRSDRTARSSQGRTGCRESLLEKWAAPSGPGPEAPGG